MYEETEQVRPHSYNVLQVTRFALAHLEHELLLLRTEFASELPEVGARDLQQAL